jgi:hypothetical protein
MSDALLRPIELTDAELEAVSGGVAVVVGIRQSNRSRQTIRQRITEIGGNVTVGGGGTTAVTSTVALLETFSAGQGATNISTQISTNIGSVTGNAAAG